eukprot:1969251-Amphidinium_carterae.1
MDMLPMLEDLGAFFNEILLVQMDSNTAGIVVASRRASEEVRVRYDVLPHQHPAVQEQQVRVAKVGTKENTADLGTFLLRAYSLIVIRSLFDECRVCALGRQT